MVMKMTIEMVQERRSWTEVHYCLSATGFADAGGPAAALGLARGACLGTGANVVNVRISEYPANRLTDDQTAGDGSGAWPAETPFFADSNFANMSVLIRMWGTVPATIPFRAPPKNLYLAGAPVGNFEVGANSPGPDLIFQQDFAAAVNNYLTFLRSPTAPTWGYRCRFPKGSFPVMRLVSTNSLPPQIGIQTAAPITDDVTSLPLAVGGEVYLTGFRRLNPTLQNLSGAYIITSVVPSTGGGPWTYTLQNTAGVNPDNYTHLGSVAPLDFAIAQYQGAKVKKAVSRKRGGSLGAPRGRSKSRR